MSDTDNRVLAGSYQGRKGHVISRKPGAEVPENAIPVHPSLAAKIKLDSLKDRPFVENWAIHSGYYITGLSFFSSAILMYNLRRKLKLFAGGRIISYGATTGGPATIAGLFYDEIISKPIMQGTGPTCTTCLPLKAACINLVSGFMVPTTMVYICSSFMARSGYTYKLPPAHEFTSLLKALDRVSYKLRPLLGVNLLLSLVVPFTVAYFEQKTFGQVAISYSEYNRYSDDLT